MQNLICRVSPFVSLSAASLSTNLKALKKSYRRLTVLLLGQGTAPNWIWIGFCVCTISLTSGMLVWLCFYFVGRLSLITAWPTWWGCGPTWAWSQVTRSGRRQLPDWTAIRLWEDPGQQGKHSCCQNGGRHSVASNVWTAAIQSWTNSTSASK